MLYRIAKTTACSYSNRKIGYCLLLGEVLIQTMSRVYFQMKYLLLLFSMHAIMIKLMRNLLNEYQIASFRYLACWQSQLCITEWQDICNCWEGNKLHAIYSYLSVGRIQHCKTLHVPARFSGYKPSIRIARLTHLHLLGEDTNVPISLSSTQC